MTFHLYTNHEDWIWGTSLDEAVAAYAAELETDEFEDLEIWDQVPDDKSITITDDDPSDDEDGEVVRTAREWAEEAATRPSGSRIVCTVNI